MGFDHTPAPSPQPRPSEPSRVTHRRSHLPALPVSPTCPFSLTPFRIPCAIGGERSRAVCLGALEIGSWPGPDAGHCNSSNRAPDIRIHPGLGPGSGSGTLPRLPRESCPLEGCRAAARRLAWRQAFCPRPARPGQGPGGIAIAQPSPAQPSHPQVALCPALHRCTAPAIARRWWSVVLRHWSRVLEGTTPHGTAPHRTAPHCQTR